ncbi:reverse transcriptase [Phytophthora megakarya]|uniref:Reverse transcriptase n=1 Tax=Phytophthora megakarya TaxID=4795 RepID=A0A225VYW7_9STRA|nr:reverse transcriptase [Phytophthora megakarya]
MSTEDTGNATVKPAKTGANPLSEVPDASDVDPAAIQSERRRRIAIAQDEYLKWINLKMVLRGNSDKLKYRAARAAWKIAERFLLTDDNVLYYMNSTPQNQQDNQEELRLRLVVPTTMIQEVLQNNHDSLEGGHQGVVRTYQRVKQDYYWFGLYTAVENTSSKSKPQLRGYSPGNILAESPFQIVSMDFVIPLPKSRRGNTALLLFQCAFTGFVIAKLMSDTTAFKVAQVFEECIYRRFGAPSLIRHDRDPRFMSEVFQAFAEMMQSKSRATLSYRPHANGQQERSVKTVMQSVKVSAEDPLQQDWDEITEHLVFAINNSMDTTRKEIHFYLGHGWDASPTMKAMPTSLRHGTPRQYEALAWRREVNRQQEVVWRMAQEY